MTLINIVSILAALATAMCFSFVLMPVAYKLAFKIGAIDTPKDDRRMHTTPTPRIGGLAIFLGFLISIATYSAIAKSQFLSRPMIGMLIGATILVVLGTFDDALDLKAWFKLIVQFLAAGISVSMGVRMNVFNILHIETPQFLQKFDFVSFIFTIIWIVAITNAVNFIDGIDGLAAGVSSISSLSVLIIVCITKNMDIAIIAAALAGACIGFLPFNLNPAKIFMGDCGATFLGFVLACISVSGLFKSYLVVSFAVPFLVLALPIFDTLSAIFRRVAKGNSPMQADREHLHHKLIDFGFSQKQVVAIIYGFSAILSLIAIILTGSTPIRAFTLTVCALGIVLISAVLIGKPKNRPNKKDKQITEEEK